MCRSQVSGSSLYKLTPWRRILLEKLLLTQLVMKFRALCGTVLKKD